MTDPTVDIPTDGGAAPGPSASDAGAELSGTGGSVSSITVEDGSEYLLVDPGELIIGPNVRTEADLATDFKGFAKDIGRRGVRAPIIAQRNADGALVVVEGQMRTLAAINNGQKRVRVLVEPDLAPDDKAREIARIVNQLNDNFHRTANTDADEVRATQQLLGLEVTARSLEQLRSIPRKRAKTLMAVAASTAAAGSVTDGIADLTQAAVFVEFDNDPDAITALTECLQKDPARFDHLAQRLRDDREETRLRAEVATRLAEQGITVIDEPDTYGGPVRPLSELRATTKTQPGNRLTVKRHAKCPGHAAYLDYNSRRPTDKRVETVYVCTDYRQHQHPLLWQNTTTTTTGIVAGQRGGTMTDEQKAYRRTVIRNGKAWDSATTVRRRWLTDFAARRTAPKDAAPWLARIFADGGVALRTAMEKNHPLAAELLGLAPSESSTSGYYRYRGDSHPIADAAATATPGRATMLCLVMVLAAIEDSTDRRRTWEHPSREQKAYFTQLAAWGYPLDDVEQFVVDYGQPTTTSATVADQPGGESDTAGESAHVSDQSPDGGTERDSAGEPVALAA